jgi:hypothetical protein
MGAAQAFDRALNCSSDGRMEDQTGNSWNLEAGDGTRTRDVQLGKGDVISK